MSEENKILKKNIKGIRLLNEAVDGNVIENAINNYEYIYIYYSGDNTIQKGYRVVKPFVYGTYNRADSDTPNNGKYVLRAWEESGNSDSFYGIGRTNRRKNHEYFTDYHGTSPGWRLFFVDKITSILPTGKKFNLEKDGFPPNYKGDSDKEINVITSISRGGNKITTSGLDSGIKPDVVTQNVDDKSVFSGQKNNRFYAFNAGAKQREIAKDDVQKIYNRIKNISKKNVRDYIIATDSDGNFVPLHKKYKDIISKDSYIGDLYDMYNKMGIDQQQMPSGFYEKTKNDIIRNLNK